MSEQESTLDEFAQTSDGSNKYDVSVGELQQLEESPIESWQLVKLGEILSLEYGDNLPSGSREDGNVPVYGSNGQVDTHSEASVNKSGIILGRKGSIGEIRFSDQPFWPIDTTYYITSEETNENLRFLYFLLENIQLERLNAASAIPGLNRNDTYGLNAVVPSLDEQRKIATVLYTVDQVIEKIEEIVKQLERAKQGVCQKLFSEGYKDHSEYKSTKYGKIPAEWDVEKLSEVTNQIQAGGTPDTNVSEYYNGDVPWVKTGELSQYRLTKTEQKITEKGLNESSARLFSPGTVLIAMYGATTGEVCFLEIEAATNQACCGIVTTDRLVSEFLFHQLNYLSGHLESLSAGSGQQNISKAIIQKFDVLVPSTEEQNNIIEILNRIDNSIAKNKSMIEHYQYIKQGLMQDLLSGTVRTTDTNITVPDEVAQHG